MKRLALMMAALGQTSMVAKESWDLVPVPQQVDEGIWNLPGVWSWSPGFYAPKFNQRKARRAARRTNKAVSR